MQVETPPWSGKQVKIGAHFEMVHAIFFADLYFRIIRKILRYENMRF